MNVFASEWSPTPGGSGTISMEGQNQEFSSILAQTTSPQNGNVDGEVKDISNETTVAQVKPTHAQYSVPAITLKHIHAHPYSPSWEPLPPSTLSLEALRASPPPAESKLHPSSPEFFPSPPSMGGLYWKEATAPTNAPLFSSPKDSSMEHRIRDASEFFPPSTSFRSWVKGGVPSMVLTWDDDIPGTYSDYSAPRSAGNSVLEYSWSGLNPPSLPPSQVGIEGDRDWSAEFVRILNLTEEMVNRKGNTGNSGGSTRTADKPRSSSSTGYHTTGATKGSKKETQKSTPATDCHPRDTERTLPSSTNDTTSENMPNPSRLVTWADALRMETSKLPAPKHSDPKKNDPNDKSTKSSKKQTVVVCTDKKGSESGGKTKGKKEDKSGGRATVPTKKLNTEGNRKGGQEEEDQEEEKESEARKPRGVNAKFREEEQPTSSPHHGKWEEKNSAGVRGDGKNLPPLTKHGNHRWKKLTKGQQRRVLTEKNAFESFVIALLHTQSSVTASLRIATKRSLPHIKVDQRFGKPGQPQSAIAQFVVAPMVTTYRPRHFHDITPGDLLEYHYDLSHVLEYLSTSYALLIGYGPTWKRFAVPYAYIACQNYLAEMTSLCPLEMPNLRAEPVYEEDILKDITDVVLSVEGLELLQQYSIRAAMRKRLHMAQLYDMLDSVFCPIENYRIEMWHMDQVPSTFVLKANRAEVEAHRPIYLDGNAELWDHLPEVTREELKERCTVWQKAKGNQDVQRSESASTHATAAGGTITTTSTNAMTSNDVGRSDSTNGKISDARGGNLLGLLSFNRSEGKDKVEDGVGRGSKMKKGSTSAHLSTFASKGSDWTNTKNAAEGMGKSSFPLQKASSAIEKRSLSQPSSADSLYKGGKAGRESKEGEEEAIKKWMLIIPIAISLMCMTVTLRIVLHKKRG